MSHLRSIPKYGIELNDCPSDIDSEDNVCKSRQFYLSIIAYLEVTGSAYEPPSHTNYKTLLAKILPIKVEIPFKVDFRESSFSSTEVKKCDIVRRTNSPNAGAPNEFMVRVTLGAQIINPIRYDRPGLPAYTREELDNCVKGTVNFLWVSGLLSASAAASGQASLGGIVGPFPVGLSGGASGDTSMSCLLYTSDAADDSALV